MATRQTLAQRTNPKGNRRSQRKRKARANYAKQPQPSPNHEYCLPKFHYAMHGTAVSPDTNAIAEYK
jgi:hypothetical protein